MRNGTIPNFDIEDVVEEEEAEEAVLEEEAVIDEIVDDEVAAVEEEAVEHEVYEEEVVKEKTVQENIILSDVTQENDAERMQDLVFTAGNNNTMPEREGNEAREDTIFRGLGVTSLQRSGSLRDHSPVFQVINNHPTPEKMKEGVVYILEHKENSSLFKIGWSSKSAEERLHQPNNCYGINTKIIYETKRFVGAPQAEKIAQVILRHANIRVLECIQCKGGHREWFAAPRETVCETVMQVEEFVQMPAYTLQDGEYKLSPEAYSRVVKQMCDFSIFRLKELMQGPREKRDEMETSSKVLIEAVPTILAQITDTPLEMSRPNSSHGLSEIQQFNESFISTSSHNSKSQKQLSAGAKLAKRMKRLFSIRDSVKGYLSRSREPRPETDEDTKRAFGSVFVDLKDKTREVGTKARKEAREFRRDFKEELHRKSEEQTA